MPLTIALPGFGGCASWRCSSCAHDDLEATNTKEAPDRVAPKPLGGVELAAERLTATLAPASWNLIRLARLTDGYRTTARIAASLFGSEASSPTVTGLKGGRSR